MTRLLHFLHTRRYKIASLIGIAATSAGIGTLTENWAAFLISMGVGILFFTLVVSSSPSDGYY